MTPVALRHRHFRLLWVGLVSGVAAAALDCRRLLLTTQLAMAVLAAILAAVTFRGVTATWPIYLVTSLTAAVGAFDLPARQSLVPMLRTPSRNL